MVGRDGAIIAIKLKPGEFVEEKNIVDAELYSCQTASSLQPSGVGQRSTIGSRKSCNNNRGRQRYRTLRYFESICHNVFD